eukprot:Nitzschia sp. Nitz4//scaffold10_size219509//93822//95162//NITZ4_001425-RA/size219509-processed-gene-0.74-mRNA-1//1//CDS//3329532911//3661//frame0
MFGAPIPEAEQTRSQTSDQSAMRNRHATRDARTDTSGDLVCDYDQSVTTLYELLESSQWDKARLRCRTHPEEVQTWIVRRDAGGSVRWKLLPLHAAVIFQAPYAVIEAMLTEYPVAAGKRDDQGMLALHLAFRHKQDERLLELLMAQYPQAVAAQDRRDRIPLDHGRETQYSASLVQSYAEAFAKCKGTRPPSQPAVSVEETTKQYESKLDALQAQYEAQMAALHRTHEQELRDFKQKMEQDQHVVRTQHDQEMDELRDLLSREVAAGQHSRQVQQQVEDLQGSLSQAKAENQALREMVKDQKSYQTDLKELMQQVLEEQQTLQNYCVQQQQELEQAQQVREQLLRSLAQKDDANAIQSSREICQLSESLRHRTEQLLNRVSKGSSRSEPERKKAPKPVGPMTVPDDHPGEGYQAPPLHGDANAAWGEQELDDHGDDISAITDDHY